MGPKAAPAVSVLIEILKDDKNSMLRYESAVALGRIGPGAQAAREPLTVLLHGRDITLRGYAAAALARISPDKVRDAVQLLRSLMAEQEGLVRGHAARGIG